MICAVANLAAEFYEMSVVELICINLSESHLQGREGSFKMPAPPAPAKAKPALGFGGSFEIKPAPCLPHLPHLGGVPSLLNRIGVIRMLHCKCRMGHVVRQGCLYKSSGM